MYKKENNSLLVNKDRLLNSHQTSFCGRDSHFLILNTQKDDSAAVLGILLVLHRAREGQKTFGLSGCK